VGSPRRQAVVSLSQRQGAPHFGLEDTTFRCGWQPEQSLGQEGKNPSPLKETSYSDSELKLRAFLNIVMNLWVA